MNDHFLERLAREKAEEWTAEADRAALSRLARKPARATGFSGASVVRDLIRSLPSLSSRVAGWPARRLVRRHAEPMGSVKPLAVRGVRVVASDAEEAER